MACCPFHSDKSPSMKLDERYYCFGCGATGDAVDLDVYKRQVQGGVSYELAKSRLSIRFLPPYSEERRQKASEYAKKHGLNSQQG